MNRLSVSGLVSVNKKPQINKNTRWKLTKCKYVITVLKFKRSMGTCEHAGWIIPWIVIVITVKVLDVCHGFMWLFCDWFELFTEHWTHCSRRFQHLNYLILFWKSRVTVGVIELLNVLRLSGRTSSLCVCVCVCVCLNNLQSHTHTRTHLNHQSVPSRLQSAC